MGRRPPGRGSAAAPVCCCLSDVLVLLCWCYCAWGWGDCWMVVHVGVVVLLLLLLLLLFLFLLSAAAPGVCYWMVHMLVLLLWGRGGAIVVREGGSGGRGCRWWCGGCVVVEVFLHPFIYLYVCQPCRPTTLDPNVHHKQPPPPQKRNMNKVPGRRRRGWP
jgi:hypothetical protein